jgi:hypothetical protein
MKCLNPGSGESSGVAGSPRAYTHLLEASQFYQLAPSGWLWSSWYSRPARRGGGGVRVGLLAKQSSARGTPLRVLALGMARFAQAAPGPRSALATWLAPPPVSLVC